MPFHLRFDSKEQFGDFKNYEDFRLKIDFFNKFNEGKFSKLKLSQVKSLKKQVKNEILFDKLIRLYFDGDFLSPNESKKLLDNHLKWKKDKKNNDVDFSADHTIFKVNTTTLQDLIKQVPSDVNYRLIIKFGCDVKNNNFKGLRIFISAMSRSAGNPEIDEYIECVPITSTSLTPIQKKTQTPINTITDNFSDRIKKIKFNTPANENNKKYERGGVAHHINPSGGERGFIEFLNGVTSPYIYIYPAYGPDRSGNENFNTIVFSEFSDLDSKEFVNLSTRLSTLYDYGSSCCPPQ